MEPSCPSCGQVVCVLGDYWSWWARLFTLYAAFLGVSLELYKYRFSTCDVSRVYTHSSFVHFQRGVQYDMIVV